MSISLRSVRTYQLMAGLWLCCCGPAWAGRGGPAGTIPNLQKALTGICATVAITCPPLPTVTELILEIAGLTDTRPEMVRYVNKVPPGNAVNAGNPPTTGSEVDPSTLVPLAFVSAQSDAERATATRLDDPTADTLFYAVISKQFTIQQPDTLSLIYEHLPWTKQKFHAGQHLGDISLPLVVLNSNGSERQVPATLQIQAACTGGTECISASIVGDFLGDGTTQTHSAADVGISFSLDFGPSPISSRSHAFVGVQVPLVVTHLNDPPYFAPHLDNPRPTFAVDALGFTPVSFLHRPIGASPVAAPFNASLANHGDDNNGPDVGPLPAVAADLTFGIDGETLASAPLPMSPSP